MSAKMESIPLPTKKQKIPTAVKIIAVALIPLIVLVVSLFAYGTYIQNASRIYPNVTIAGVDVSGLTRFEATQALGLHTYEERIDNTSIVVNFPDSSERVISGRDAMMQYNASEMVAAAYSVGRGQGVLQDLFSYFQRYNATEAAFDIEFYLNPTALQTIIAEITEVYNEGLDSSVPEIFEDRIVFTKGAGQVNANEEYLFELAYAGLFTSLESGDPVEVNYTLRGDISIIFEILDLREEIFIEPVSAEFNPETISATECVTGVDFDPIEAARVIGGLEAGETTTLYFEFTEPELTQGYLDSMLFRDLIGRRTTHAAGGSGRLTNITIANEAIHGMILLPGEEFSFNETVGPRTRERGFQTATILSGGQFIPGIGGGICQTSSTIFAAIRPSELLVTERRPHGRPINYLPPGWDATVAWGHIDFRFVNNTDFPLRIDITLEYRTVLAEVWGTIVDDFPREADWNS